MASTCVPWTIVLQGVEGQRTRVVNVIAPIVVPNDTVSHSTESNNWVTEGDIYGNPDEFLLAALRGHHASGASFFDRKEK